MEGVASITVYATVLEGDIYLYGSGSDPFPDFSDNLTQLVFNSANRLTFTPDDFEGSNSIYIAVYAYDLSSYTLGVVVKRKATQSNQTSDNKNQSSHTQATALLLPPGVSQEFTLDADTRETIFVLKPTTNDTITITIQ